MDYFFAKFRKSYFWCVLGHYPQNEIFSQKSDCQFFTLKTPYLLEKRQKNPMSHFKENMFIY